MINVIEKYLWKLNCHKINWSSWVSPTQKKIMESVKKPLEFYDTLVNWSIGEYQTVEDNPTLLFFLFCSFFYTWRTIKNNFFYIIFFPCLIDWNFIVCLLGKKGEKMDRQHSWKLKLSTHYPDQVTRTNTWQCERSYQKKIFFFGWKSL